MARVLLLILLGWILYVVIKRIIATRDTPAVKNARTAEKPPESIVQCSQCGLHVPESESHLTNNVVTCNNPECNHTVNSGQSKPD